MGLPTTDGRKLWLDESQLHANNFLTIMLDAEKKYINCLSNHQD